MFTARITSKLIWLGMAVNLSVWLILHLPAQFGVLPHYSLAEGSLRTVALCAAYSMAVILNLEIAGEYKSAIWLRLGWLALAANAAFSIVRMLIESPLINLISEDYTRRPLAGLLQHVAILPANTFLLLGMLAMWRAYHQVGLGFTIERRDYAAIAAILGLMVALLFFRQGLSEARSPYFAARVLQQSGLVMLSLGAAVSLVLYRIAVQMGGGKLAISLRFLTLYTLMRAVMVLIQALFRLISPGLNHPLTVASLFLDLGWQSVPWLAALAAAYRAELTLHAAHQLAQQRAAKTALVSA